jgi:hypothetical protein
MQVHACSSKRFGRGVVLAAALCASGVSGAAAQEQFLFPSRSNALDAIVAKINAETVRIDVATWYLTERTITNALIARRNAGVTVRVIGDRVSIFEIDPNTRREFEHLATNGVPIRLRYHPTDFPSIMHWKAGIFVGLGDVEFGSANWTSFELMPVSSTNFKDETVMFTDDAALVSAFRSRFDQFWADTSNFLDWPVAYERETGTRWTVPMTINRTRLEPNVSGPSSMIWEQGSVMNNRMASEIRAESRGIDMVVYRLSNAGITDALISRIGAGVPVRIMVEPGQYREDDWPEYWLTGAQLDRLWMAGAQMKERAHLGLTHMKVLITSASAMHGSSKFTNNWQRDHNYFIPASTRPALYNALRDEFDRMWSDGKNYRAFVPKPPAAPVLSSPPHLAVGVSRTTRLTWNATPWAVSFDVYLGTAPADLRYQGRVNAVLTESPPATYSWAPASALQSGTQYYWQIVARTFATDADPGLVAGSSVRSFVTEGPAPGGAGGSGGTDVLLWRHTSTGELLRWDVTSGVRVSSASLSPDRMSNGWRLAAFTDFNRDGEPDLLWHDSTSGALTVWLMRGTTRIGQTTPAPSTVSPSWHLETVADFNRDGHVDWVWRHEAGDILVWMMNGLTRTSAVATDPPFVSPTWSIVGSGDFNGDGRQDLVWRHDAGSASVWMMDGTRQLSTVAVSPTVDPSWRLAGVADVSGDSRPDFVWHHQTLGLLSAWLFSGTTRTDVIALSPDTVHPSWSIEAVR